MTATWWNGVQPSSDFPACSPGTSPTAQGMGAAQGMNERVVAAPQQLGERTRDLLMETKLEGPVPPGT